MKKTYRLNAEQRLILEKAKRGYISEDLKNALEAVIRGKASNPVHNLRTVYLVDDTYDGKEDRGKTFRFAPENRLNILGAVCLEKYGMPFGPIVVAYLLSARPGENRRAAAKWRKELIEQMFPFVDLGEKKCKSTRRKKRGT